MSLARATRDSLPSLDPASLSLCSGFGSAAALWLSVGKLLCSRGSRRWLLTAAALRLQRDNSAATSVSQNKSRMVKRHAWLNYVPI